MDRRNLLLALGAAFAAPVAPRAWAGAAPVSAFGLDAQQFGLRAGTNDDQTRALQRALDEAARARVPLAIAPGTYKIGAVRLPAGAHVQGIRGATRLMFTGGASLFSAERADHVTLTGLTMDGAGQRLAQGRGLLHFQTVDALKVAECEIANAGGTALHAIGVEGEISGNAVTNSAETAIHSLDARGLLIARNRVAGAGNNGIQVWRGQGGDDGTIVTENRIEGIENRSGGSGQYGNAINVFRAANVIVRANRIRDCAFTAVRGNAASNIQIEGNTISSVREVAIYSEFGFEGAAISNNVIDVAAIGVSVTNFNDGGRLAVIQGNLIRNLLPQRPAGTDPGDGAGIGISAEADTAITGNTIENAPTAGLWLGFGQYMRDIAATGNVIRRAGIGIAVSVSTGAGPALIANNLISETMRGAIVGMDRRAVATADLVRTGAERFAHLTVSGNRVR